LQNFLIGDDYIQNWGPIPALTGFVVAGVLMTFGLAQWLPYWTRSTLIAFCISPVLAIFSLGYIGFLLSFLSPPWWLVSVSIGISFLATRIMLRPWMDGRTGLKYWLSHSALLAGALVLPFIPLLFTFATYPSMPTALRQELTEEVKDYMPFTKGIELTIPKKRNEDIYGDYGSHGLSDSNGDENSVVDSATTEAETLDETKDEFVGLSDSVSDLIETLERKVTSLRGPVIYSSFLMKAVIKEAQLMSLRINSDNDEPGDRQQEYRERYQRSLILLSKFAIHMRMSDQLMDQEVSDRMERWLVNELELPGRKELFSDEEYSAMVAALADQTGRQKSRRRAVVVAWHRNNLSRYDMDQGRSDFGGLDTPGIPQKSPAASWLVAERNVGRATAALLDYLDSKPPVSDQFPVEILTFWPYGDVETERTLEISDVRTPAVLWHQDWETKAAQLNESLK
ncbi:hypothetical protein N9Y42_07040, partial [Mariniblastus sp.]|nr:hypothetical protein [Mariniblastus sp.]